MTLVKAFAKFLLGTVIVITFFFLLYRPLPLQEQIKFDREIGNAPSSLSTKSKHQKHQIAPKMHPEQRDNTRSSIGPTWTKIQDFISIHHLPIYLKELKGWEVNKSRNASLYVRPGKETVLLVGARVCPPSPLLLLTVVLSAADHFPLRSAIRETWGKVLPANTAVMFFLGKPDNETLMESLREEQATYQDLVQEDFTESYNNLTVASIFMLKFIVNRCTHAQYILKADDDLYLNLFKLHEVLRGPNKFPAEELRLLGYVITGGAVSRNPTEKWYTPNYMYNDDFYPDYLSGCAYLMSRKVASTLYDVSLRIPMLHHEDVFITGICARKAGIKPLKLEGVLYRYQHNFSVCNSPQIIAVHRFTPKMLRDLWKPIEEHKCNLTPGTTV